MKRAHSASDLPATIRRAAGGWLARRDRGFSPAEQADFAHWLASDPRHGQAVAQLARTFAAFDRIRDLAPAAIEDRAPDPDVFAPPPRSRHGRLVGPFAVLAAAAALAVLLFRPAPRISTGGHQEFTAVHAAERVTLADGSTVNLNRGTTLTVALSASARHIHLTRGEAHFQVAKDPSRPFVVAAAGVAARAVGTAFNVRLAEGVVEVTVTEGRVHLAATPAADAATPAPALLSAGDHAVVALNAPSAAPVVAALDAVALEQRLAWTPRLLELHKTPLADILAQFNQRAATTPQRRLELGEPSLGTLRVGGSVRLDQPEAFARLLERSFGLRARHDGDVILLHRDP